MLDFQNRTPNIKLKKFNANQDNWAYLEKRDFHWKLVCQIWDGHWIHGVEMSLGVVSNLDSESRLALHVKRGKTFNYQFTDCLKKCDFLWTTSNIETLYTIGKHFSPRVGIRDSYLKIRLFLARINWQSFLFMHEKVRRRSGHFHCN